MYVLLLLVEKVIEEKGHRHYASRPSIIHLPCVQRPIDAAAALSPRLQGSQSV